MGVKRENDENEAQNSNFLKKAAKSSKFDKGKGKAVSKVTEVSEAAAEATLSKRQLEFLKGFYTNSITSTKTIDEVDIPWYMEEALPFYPETLDEADTAGFQLKRDRTLLFIESQQNIDRIRLFDNCSNEDKEIEVFPPEKRQLNLTVRPIFKNSDEVSFKPPGPFHVRMQNITLTHSLDSNMEMDDAVESAIASLPYFDQELPPSVRDVRKDMVLGYEYEIISLTAKEDSYNVIALVSTGSSTMQRPMKLFRYFVRRVSGVTKLHIYFDTAYLPAYESMGKLHKLLNWLKPYINSSLSRQLAKPELGNTLEFVPYDAPKGFKLSLYDYQKRSLQWMSQVEHSTDQSTRAVTRAATSHIFRFDTLPDALLNASESRLEKKVTKVMEEVDYSCKGGVLADNPGYGKTIVTLALILSNPCREISQLGMTPIQKFSMFPSKATLIVCPSNLVNQWKDEILKCLPQSIKLYTVSGIKEHRDLSWTDVMFADIVLISVKFLSNQNYKSFLVQNYGKNDEIIPESDQGVYFARKMRTIIPNRSTLCDIKGQVNFEALYYHRIVFDEFHELAHVERTSRVMAKNFKGDFHWGMTGTPRFKTVADVQMSSDCEFYGLTIVLQMDLGYDNNSFGRALSFKDRFIRRNNEDLQLPPLSDSTEWINLTPAEMALYQVRNGGNLSEIDAFMACSHYQIAEAVVDAAGESVLTTEQVSKLLYKRLIEQINELLASIAQLKRDLRDQQKLIALDDLETTQKRVAAINARERTKVRIAEEEQILFQKQRELEYFRGVMAALEMNSLEDVCLICLEHMDAQKTQLSVTKCGHIFCGGCMADFLARSYRKNCPKCRAPVQPQNVMRIAELPRPASVNAAENSQNAEQETNEEELTKCGTKVRAMISKLAAVKEENANAKVIIFVQFRRLATIIMKSLQSNGISVARVHGNHSIRSKSINRFKFDPECSVIMLSTEDSVSGLHLPEATHIFITHPFWFGSSREMHEKALSAEKQGIARAYRLGLNHPLQIIRFYTRGTIEETVSRERTEL